LSPADRHPLRRASLRVGGLAVTIAILALGCGSPAPPRIDRFAVTPSPAGPSLEAEASGGPAAAPSVGPLPEPSANTGNRLPIQTVSANWPPAAQSTPDPNFVLHVPILMYHRIIAPADAGPSLPGLVIDPMVFAQELAMLHDAGWHTITLATLELDLAHGLRPAPRTFVITIDDGHLDGLTHALPILERFGDVATYFVVLGRIHDPGFLSSTDLQTLAGAGMEIADHTMNHANVGRLHGFALDFQIGAAASAIQAITGRASSTFAYPSGESSLEAAGVIEAKGMGMAVTTKEGVLETWSDRFFVPRMRVSPSVTPEMLLRKMTGYAVD